MDIATWNVNSLRPRLPQLAQWVAKAKPDVVCMQETKVVDDLFPHADLEAMGYVHRAVWGQKTYNGVAIVSRLPLEDVHAGFLDPEPDAQARLIRARVGGVLVIDVYVPNGAEPASDKYFYKLDWLARLRAELDRIAKPDEPVLLCGDMNIAPADADAYDPFETEGTILCTKPERDAFQALLSWGMVDGWRKKSPFATEFSWWSYQASSFRKNIGFRIDHALMTRSLMNRCRSVKIDREPRTWDKPSDHAPVVVSLL
ncbi:MAG TPA: exodeoxyribonuclease III [Myxococcota bacterium]|nr:exodeoxyribonuclease III [Myxococcota bacterium]